LGEQTGRLAARFLIAPGRWEYAVRDTLVAIERVHGAGWEWERCLPCVTVDWADDTTEWVGRYTSPGRRHRLFGEWTGPRIDLWGGDRSLRLTFAHEFGHLLDDAATGFNGRLRRRFGSESATLFAEVVRLAQRTDSYRNRDAALGTGEMSLEQERDSAYTLRRCEVWCEVYAQYVALRSGDPALLAEWYALRERAPAQTWAQEEFAPIAALLDDILRLGSATLIPERR
jgi:hypothetical protein